MITICNLNLGYNTLMYNKLYEIIADKLVNEGHIIIENALEKHLCSTLYLKAKNEQAYKQAAISQTAKAHIDTNKRSDKTKWIDEDGEAQSEYLSFMQGLQTHLNRSLYLGLSYYESHFAIYEKGDFYEKHLDSFKGFKNRVVTSVYYLNEEWNEEDGGELIIYDKNNQEITKVLPKADTLVVFLSEKFPHEVLPAKKKRYSIAGWFRVDRAIF